MIGFFDVAVCVDNDHTPPLPVLVFVRSFFFASSSIAWCTLDFSFFVGCFINNLGQSVGDKFTKLSKIGFSKLIFCDFLPKIVKICLFGGRVGTRHQIQAFQGFSFKSYVVRQLVRCSLVHSRSGGKSLVAFHL